MDSPSQDITAEEIDLGLAAIARHFQGAGEIRRPPGEAYAVTIPLGRRLYINFVHPADIPVGAIYRTWIVELADGKVVQVASFRSRRGASNDDTLPDDE